MSTTGVEPHAPAPVSTATDAPCRISARGAFGARRRGLRLPPLVLPAGRDRVRLVFVIPTLLSFYFSLTRWTLFTTEFIGLDNFVQFFQEPSLTSGARNTIVYAVVTSGLKVVVGLLLATLLTSRLRTRNVLRSAIFFPVLVSTVAVGITFAVLLHPSTGLVNRSLGIVGIDGPEWLSDPSIALMSVAMVTSGKASASPS